MINKTKHAITTKKERFEEVYRYLLGKGEVESKKDLAEKLGMSRTSVSHAFSGEPAYLNDAFFLRITRKWPALNVDWLINELGTMLEYDGPDYETKPVIPSNMITWEEHERLMRELENRLVHSFNSKLMQILTARNSGADMPSIEGFVSDIQRDAHSDVLPEEK